jgi:hypothetical protein
MACIDIDQTIDWSDYYQLQQGDPNGSVNCAANVLAAGLYIDSCGAIRTTGRLVRALSDEPIPDPASPGLRHEQLADVAAKYNVGLDVHRGMQYDDVEDIVASGYTVALAVNYAPIRTSNRSGQFNFTGNHELLRRPGLTFDPLTDGRMTAVGRVYKGPGNYSRTLLRAAAGDLILGYTANGTPRRLGRGLAYAAIFPHRRPSVPTAPDTSGPVLVPDAPTPTEKNTMIVTTVASYAFRLAKGQPLFRHPGGPVVTKMSAAGNVPWVGNAGTGWTAVRVMTKAPYADGKTRPTIVYVPTKAGVRI